MFILRGCISCVVSSLGDQSRVYVCMGDGVLIHGELSRSPNPARCQCRSWDLRSDARRTSVFANIHQLSPFLRSSKAARRPQHMPSLWWHSQPWLLRRDSSQVARAPPLLKVPFRLRLHEVRGKSFSSGLPPRHHCRRLVHGAGLGGMALGCGSALSRGCLIGLTRRP